MLRSLRRLSVTPSCSRRLASTLVVAQHDNKTLDGCTLSAITAALSLGPSTTVLVAGKDCGAVADQASKIPAVSKVLLADDAAYEHAIAENMTSLIVECQSANSFTHILTDANNSGRNWAPRVAAKLDVAQISDVMSFEDEDTFTRPSYAGNAIQKVKSADAVKVCTVRGTAFEKAEETGGSGSVESAPLPSSPDAGLTTWVSNELSSSDRPELTAARVVVAGGRGLKSGENFGMLEETADKLNAAMGASRAAVDAGYVPNDMQVGQTGKVVAPDLYIAVGISGAIQHLAGMKDSKTIVAINKDPEAPIFQVADYGLVADLFKAVPEMNSSL